MVKVDQVEWVFLRDPQTQTNALVNGEIDMLEVTPSSRYPELRTNPKIEMIDVVPAGTYTAIYNHKVPPFNDARVRRAAMLAKGDQAWKPTEQRKRKVTTALKAYALLATSADRGAVRDLSRYQD